MARAKPLSVCSNEAILLVLDLAREHAGHVQLQCDEREDRLEVLLLADTQELAAYFEYMIARVPTRISSVR